MHKNQNSRLIKNLNIWQLYQWKICRIVLVESNICDVHVYCKKFMLRMHLKNHIISFAFCYVHPKFVCFTNMKLNQYQTFQPLIQYIYMQTRYNEPKIYGIYWRFWCFYEVIGVFVFQNKHLDYCAFKWNLHCFFSCFVIFCLVTKCIKNKGLLWSYLLQDKIILHILPSYRICFV